MNAIQFPFAEPLPGAFFVKAFDPAFTLGEYT
jgi:hypothetical protein